MNAPAVIAYRNPMEQWLWESGVAFASISLLVGGVLLFYGAVAFSCWRDRRKWERR